ncbi:MAG: ABC transporter substrate-binding protein [Propionibacterium sp.]|nr:ABC transporter substrate-binding protein [Propionibacterium sp.]
MKRWIAAFAAAALFLGGCASGTTDGDAPDVAATPDDDPMRVAALTYETAELVAALGAADRLVMVPEAVTNPVLTNHHEAMVAVETHAATETTTNAEAVIQAAPDLVLLSDRHGLEEGVGTVLRDAGFEVIVLPNSWASVDDMLANIRITGEALGLDDEAEELSATIESGMAARELDGERPRVLVLGNQAGQPFITAGAAFPLEVLRLAGGDDVSAELGFTATAPITVEQVVQADPDAILLIDMNGSGRRLFEPIMDSPAIATLAGSAEDRVLLLEGRQVQALGLEHAVEGLDAINAWLTDLE